MHLCPADAILAGWNANSTPGRNDEWALVAPYLPLMAEDAPSASIACGRSAMAYAGSSVRGPRGG